MNIGDIVRIDDEVFEAVPQDGSGCENCPFLDKSRCPILCWTDDGIALMFKPLFTSESVHKSLEINDVENEDAAL